MKFSIFKRKKQEKTPENLSPQEKIAYKLLKSGATAPKLLEEGIGNPYSVIHKLRSRGICIKNSGGVYKLN